MNKFLVFDETLSSLNAVENEVNTLNTKSFFKDGTRAMTGNLNMANNDLIGGSDVILDNQVSVSSPDPTKLKIFSKTDNKLYIKDSLGVETDLTSGGVSIDSSGTVNGLNISVSPDPIIGTGTITLGGTLTVNDSDWSGTDLSISNGGTGESTAQAAIDSLSAVSGASANNIFTKIGSNASWVAPNFINASPSSTSNSIATWNGTSGKALLSGATTLTNSGSNSVFSRSGSDFLQYKNTSVSLGKDALQGGSNFSAALGMQALQNSSGQDNIGIGSTGGKSITTGSGNICIGNTGSSGDAYKTKIGNSLSSETHIFGIHSTTALSTWKPVRVNTVSGTLNAQLGVGKYGAVISIPFGADMDATNRFAVANGKAEEKDENSKEETRQPLCLGKIIKLLYKTEQADNTTDLNIRINGVSDNALTLDADSGVSDLDITVSDGDYVEIQFTSGTTPQRSTFLLILDMGF